MMRMLLKGNARLHRLIHTMPIENTIAVGLEHAQQQGAVKICHQKARIIPTLKD